MKKMFALFFFSSVGLAQSYKQSIADQELITHGKTFYTERCSGCHGDKGDGKGPGSIFLNPKPRDFTSGIYKFKSTSAEHLPLQSDLMKTLSQGVLGTSMPEFSLDPEISRLAVIQYIKTFSPVWKDKTKLGAKKIGSTFPRDDFSEGNFSRFITRAKSGRALYIEACATCHGHEGRGDGPGAEGLEDDWGQLITPADFSKTYIKSGKTPEDIYQVLLSGIGGTPMVSFADTYTTDQLWDLVAYVYYLRGLHNGSYELNNPPVEAIKKSDIE